MARVSRSRSAAGLKVSKFGAERRGSWEDGHAAPAPLEATGRQELHGAREEDVLRGQDAAAQGLHVVVVVDRDGGLEDDGAAVERVVDEVDRAAADLDPVLPGLPLGVDPGEGRQEGRVDVDDAVGEAREEVAVRTRMKPARITASTPWLARTSRSASSKVSRPANWR